MFLFEQKRQKLTAPELRAQNVQKKFRQNNRGKKTSKQRTKEFFKTAKNYRPRVARAKRSSKNSVKTTQEKNSLKQRQEESAVSRVW